MSDSRMHIATIDCVAMVQEIGARLRNVVPRYMERVKGDPRGFLNLEGLPQAKQVRVWLDSFLQINARFNGRKLNGKRIKGGPDQRITIDEIGVLEKLGNWLIRLHCETQTRDSGQIFVPREITIRIEDMIERERIIG